MSTPGELFGALGREARARLGNGRDAGTRTFRGRSVDELVPRIQRELGAEAIVVRRREGLTGGVLGFFQHPFVEIEAMPGGPGIDVYDEQDVPAAPAPAPSMPPPPPAGAQQPAPAHRPETEPPPAPPSAPIVAHAAIVPSAPIVPPPPEPAPEPRLALGYRPASQPQPPAPPPPPRSAAPAPPAPAPTPFYMRSPAEPAPDAGSAYVTAHLAALARADRSRIARREPPPRAQPGESRRDPLAWSADFQELIPREEPEPFAPAVERAPPARAAFERRVLAPERSKTGQHVRARPGVAKSLRRYGIGEDFANELIDGASAHALPLAPRAGLSQAVRATLAKRIPVARPLPTNGAAIVLVGAGGAGKTTCCAALLGAYRKSSSLPASCATVTREEERGELRMILSPYIMKPSAAGSPRALRALRRARADGVAVLDTPRVSPSDRAGVRELARVLGEIEAERVVVALPATLGATAAAQLLEALAPLGANALAITHADETDQIGVAVEAACRFGLAPEYMLERGRGGGWRLTQIDPTGLAEKLLQ